MVMPKGGDFGGNGIQDYSEEMLLELGKYKRGISLLFQTRDTLWAVRKLSHQGRKTRGKGERGKSAAVPHFPYSARKKKKKAFQRR